MTTAKSGNYKPGRTQPIEYIVVHYTANEGDTARNNLDYFARTVTGTSAHYFVDSDAVVQSVDDGDTAYHCGSVNSKHPYCRNSNSIGVEMCDSVGGVPDDVRDLTAGLVRELMDRYGVPPENVLRHYDVTGKHCPAPWVDDPEQWAQFKAMLEVDDMTQEQFDAFMENWLARKAKEPPSDWARPYIKKAIQAGILAGVDDGAGGLTIDRPQGNSTRQEMATMGVAILEAIQRIVGEA